MEVKTIEKVTIELTKSEATLLHNILESNLDLDVSDEQVKDFVEEFLDQLFLEI